MERLKSSTDSIGAAKTTWKLLSRELLDIKNNFKGGNSITRRDLLKLKDSWVSTAPFIDADGNYFVLYIDDQAVSWRRGHRSDPKYHVSWCNTLEEMEKIGRRGRYKAKYNIENNQFKIFNGRITINKELNVCKNCLKKLAYKGYESFIGVNEKQIYENFNIYRFSQEHKNLNLKNPTHQLHSANYVKDWSKISRETKAEQNYYCGECNNDFSGNKQYLHVHHINGVKSDNRKQNLAVLCKDCHSKQAHHSHMR